MAATDNAAAHFSSKNRSAGNDSTQAKLAALLDDTTVHGALNGQSPSSGGAEGSSHLPPLPSRLAAGNPPADSTAAPASPSPDNPENANSTPASSQVAQLTAQIKSMQAHHTANEASSAAPSKPAVASNSVHIKGRGDGIVIEIGKGNWADLLSHLKERLTQATAFFRGGTVALHVGGRPLLEHELQQVCDLLATFHMQMGVIRTTAERTFDAAISLGLAAKLETAEGETDAEIEAAASNRTADHHFVYRGNLRSGQILERAEHVLVIGDVNPGAEVISAGDILVWGRVRGLIHAGAEGDGRSVVLALDLEPIQLRIANVLATADDLQSNQTYSRWGWKRSGKRRPAIAYVAQERIVVEPWDDSKPGGISAFRR
jgi:septum site-determining protein MinC